MLPELTDADLRELGFADGDLVDLISEWEDGLTRRADGFRLVAYSTPQAAYTALIKAFQATPQGKDITFTTTAPSGSIQVRVMWPG